MVQILFPPAGSLLANRKRFELKTAEKALVAVLAGEVCHLPWHGMTGAAASATRLRTTSAPQFSSCRQGTSSSSHVIEDGLSSPRTTSEEAQISPFARRHATMHNSSSARTCQ